jgi:hypothetical protein
MGLSGGRFCSMGGGAPLSSEGRLIAGVGVSRGTVAQASAFLNRRLQKRPRRYSQRHRKDTSLFAMDFRRGVNVNEFTRELDMNVVEMQKDAPAKFSRLEAIEMKLEAYPLMLASSLA